MSNESFSLEIRNVTGGVDLDRVKSLLRAYTSFLATCTAPGEINLDRRLAELEKLSETHRPPLGGLLLAQANGVPAGCVAFGPITLPSGEGAAELRRMWVSPAFRGQAIGQSLIVEASSIARSAGYHWMYLDCLSGVMPAAMKVYRTMGFEPTERYKQDHSVEETAFLRLDLCRHDVTRQG